MVKSIVIGSCVAGVIAAGGIEARAASCVNNGDGTATVTVGADKATLDAFHGNLRLGGVVCGALTAFPAGVSVMIAGGTITFNMMRGSYGALYFRVYGDQGGTPSVDTVAVTGTAGPDVITTGSDLLFTGTSWIDMNGGGGDIDLHYIDTLRFTLGDGDDQLCPDASCTPGSYLYAQTAKVIAYGGNGDDLIFGGNTADILKGDAGTDYIYGAGGNDAVYGGDGSDVIYGEVGNDKMYGDGDADSVDGGIGNDTFYMAAANDGDDSLEGGDGYDTVSYALRAADVTVDLAAMQGGEAGEIDSLFYIERAAGGSGNDHLRGTTGKNKLYGNGGDDLLEGDVGVDTLDCGDGVDAWADPDSAPLGNCELIAP